jgi:hypothetical protein
MRSSCVNEAVSVVWPVHMALVRIESRCQARSERTNAMWRDNAQMCAQRAVAGGNFMKIVGQTLRFDTSARIKFGAEPAHSALVAPHRIVFRIVSCASMFFDVRHVDWHITTTNCVCRIGRDIVARVACRWFFAHRCHCAAAAPNFIRYSDYIDCRSVFGRRKLAQR